MSASTPWERHARQWSRVGPPLRPSPEDLAVVERALGAWSTATSRLDSTVLVMGVTPELCSLTTLEGTRVIAVDRSRDMIRAVWPGPLHRGDAAICGDWRRLPLSDRSVDVVLSDGCLSTLPFPGGYMEACAELRRVLATDGRCVARCFVQAETPEPLADVLRDLADGRVKGFHAFKWRLAMALQANAEQGVVLAEVWDTLQASEPDLAALSRRVGWSIETVRTINAYRGVAARYTFPTLDALSRLFSEAGFAILDVIHPAYELSERCPSLILGPGNLHASITSEEAERGSPIGS
ncbi:MAG TPA: class I SAM-dependent methyltransferase [Gemmatimonadota bacterium]|nr:class I SAM-dependent methyltransferase [Gemmatimonadota bacterium]